jgi:hypothetical protein
MASLEAELGTTDDGPSCIDMERQKSSLSFSLSGVPLGPRLRGAGLLERFSEEGSSTLVEVEKDCVSGDEIEMNVPAPDFLTPPAPRLKDFLFRRPTPLAMRDRVRAVSAARADFLSSGQSRPNRGASISAIVVIVVEGLSMPLPLVKEALG